MTARSPRPADPTFVAVTRSSVERLDRHGLRFVDSAATAWRQSVFFRNGTTGVEFREEDRAEFVVRIAALEDGRLAAIPSPAEPGSIFSGYDLADLIAARSPGTVIAQPVPATDASQWAANLGAWADASVAALQDHAADVLDGDVDVFDELDARARARPAADVAGRTADGGSS